MPLLLLRMPRPSRQRLKRKSLEWSNPLLLPRRTQPAWSDPFLQSPQRLPMRL